MPDHSGGISGNNSVRLYIVRNDTAGSDHRILTDGNTRKNGRTGSDPRPPADMYRLAGNYRPIFQIVVIGYKLNICGYLDVIVDSNSSCRHHQTTGHNDYIAPEFHVGSPDTRKRSLDATSLAEIREHLMQQFIVLFSIRHRMVQPEDILPQLLCFGQLLCCLIPAVDSQFFHKPTCLPVSPILRLALHLR